MACEQGIREAIEQSKEFYRKQKEYDPFRELWLNLVKKDSEYGFSSLTREEQIYFSVVLFEGEVYNGGIHQFFSNSSGELYSEVLESLKMLKAEKSLALLKQAVEVLFGEVTPPKNRVERWNVMKQFPEDDSIEPEWIKKLCEIDKKLRKESENLLESLDEYAEKTELIQPFKR